MRHKIWKILMGIIMMVAYIKLVCVIHHLLQVGMPQLIFGTWRTFIVLGLIATSADTILMLLFWGIGWLASHFYRPLAFRIIGCIVSAIAFILSEIQLWQFIDALYYAGFWEYVWGCTLTALIFIAYSGIASMVFFYQNNKEEA